MKTKFYILSSIILAHLLLVSCSDDDDFYIDPILDVSTNSITFEKDAESQEVEVTVNKGDEFYTTISSVSDPESFEEWISITEGEQGFTVAVTENRTRETRTATIKVRVKKGDKQTDISVSQNYEGGPNIGVSQEQIEAVAQSTEHVLYVTFNSDQKWSVESPQEWIKLTPNYERKKVDVVIEENEEYTKREGSIEFSVEGETIKTAVYQNGAFYFDMPYLDFGFNYYGETERDRGYKNRNNLHKAFEFEFARGSKEKSKLGDTHYYLTTTSPIFSEVDYITGFYDTFTVIDARYTMADKESFPLKEYQEFLEEEGFKHAYDADADSLFHWNEEMQMMAFVNMNYGHVKFDHTNHEPDDRYNQRNSYETFKEFPYPCIEWGADFETVEKWEKSKGSKLHEHMLERGLVTFTPDQTLEPWVIERGYEFEVDGDILKLKKVTVLYNEINSIFYWPGYDHNRYPAHTYVMTREFKDFLNTSGFVQRDTPPQNNREFEHKDKNVVVEPYAGRYAAEDEMRRACMYFYSKSFK